MSHWADDRKGNEIHEGDIVKFDLPAYVPERAKPLQGRIAVVKKLTPGMPYRALLTQADPVTKQILKEHNQRPHQPYMEVPCNMLRIVD